MKAFVVALVLLAASPAWAQKWEPLRAEDAAMTFAGDAAPVSQRRWRRFYNRDSERVSVPGGIITYTVGHPGQELVGRMDAREDLLQAFNQRKATKRRGVSATTADVQVGQNRYGTYYWVSVWGAKGGCVVVRQFFGDAYGVGPGNKRIDAGSCGSLSDRAEREKTMSKLMQSVRIKE